VCCRPHRAIGAARDRDIDAQPVALDLDLEPSDSLAERSDVLIETTNFVARPRALGRGGATRSTRLLLPREILLGDALNDLSSLVHPVEQLGLQIDQSLAQIRELSYRAQLFRTIREKLWIIDDGHDFPRKFCRHCTPCKCLAAPGTAIMS
jgi:hypothetical protein